MLPLDDLEDISALNKCFGDDAGTMEHRRQEIRSGKEGQNMYCTLECMQKSVFFLQDKSFSFSCQRY
jgi:hypothetical protein